jgi:mono/diheme cytochrome c family protein
MIMRTLMSTAVLVCLAVAPSATRAERILLRSVHVDLPSGDRTVPDGRGAAAVNNNCLACHSADMMLNQPAMAKTQWEAEVNKMRIAYKAPIDPNDVEAIVDYLANVPSAK